MSSPEPKRVLKTIRRSGIIPVFYHEDPEVCKKVTKACYEGGLRVFEFANGGARAQENYIMLRKYAQRHLPELYLGIGTIKDPGTAGTFIRFNADFIVSPVIDSDIGKLCREGKVLWIPGCSTPTEIAIAERCGASLIKLFPGEVLGTHYLKAILPAFPGLQFIPAGGVEPTATTILNWLAAGAPAVNMDDRLMSREIIEQNDFNRLKEQVQSLSLTIKKWRHRNNR
jgi:2-dehydro-3-deoxyphosphogluconate aldolase/(4S)-4-hydroxy-2-oxoglutarate aldolase